MGQFTDRALRVLLVIIALAILGVAARYIVFTPGAQCPAGTSQAWACTTGPGF